MKKLITAILLLEISILSSIELPTITTGSKSNLYFNEPTNFTPKALTENFYLSTAFRLNKYIDVFYRFDFNIASRFTYYSNIDYLHQYNFTNYLRTRFRIKKFSFYINTKPYYAPRDQELKIGNGAGFAYNTKVFKLKNDYTFSLARDKYTRNGLDSCDIRSYLNIEFHSKNNIQHSWNIAVYLTREDFSHGHNFYLEKIRCHYQLRCNLNNIEFSHENPLENEYDFEEY